MNKIILDGKSLSTKLYSSLKEKYDKLREKYGRKAGLAFILVGDNEASKIYLKNKSKICDNFDIYQETYKFSEKISEEELLLEIEKLNNNSNIDGILIQLPLPETINTLKITSKINPLKDVDGFNSENVGNLLFNYKGLKPATPKGILTMLKSYNIDIEGKEVTIIGRSNIVGKPLALMLINEGATVVVCNSKTPDLKKYTKEADILIVAAGSPNLIGKSDIKDGVVIIDVGINKVNGKICGDVNFNEIIRSNKKIFISPVPGGVGPMTIYSLIENTIKAYELNFTKH